MKIREYSLKYAKQKKQMKSKEADLEASIFWLEKSIEQNELPNHEKDKLTDELNTKKKELEQFVQYKTRYAKTNQSMNNSLHQRNRVN